MQADVAPDDNDLEMETLEFEADAAAGASGGVHHLLPPVDAGPDDPTARAAKLRCARMTLLSVGAVALTVALLFAAVWAWSALNPAALNPSAPLPALQPLARGVAPNGMPYAVYSYAYPRGCFASNLRVRAGSLQEDDDQLGIAHLVEHMAFDNTADFVGRNAVFRALESLGVGYNAWTWFRNTVYQMWNAPVAQLDAVLRVHANQATRLQLVAEHLALEKGAVFGEGRRANSSGYMFTVQFWDNHLDGAQLMHRWTIGEQDVIGRANVAVVGRFVSDWYHASRMELQLVGDFRGANVTATIAAAVARAFPAPDTAPPPRAFSTPAWSLRPRAPLVVSPPLMGQNGIAMQLALSRPYVREPRMQSSIVDDASAALLSNAFSVAAKRVAAASFQLSSAAALDSFVALSVDESLFEFNTTISLLAIEVPGDVYSAMAGDGDGALYDVSRHWEPYVATALVALRALSAGDVVSDAEMLQLLRMDAAAVSAAMAATQSDSATLAKQLLGNGDHDVVPLDAAAYAALRVAASGADNLATHSAFVRRRAAQLLDAVRQCLLDGGDALPASFGLVLGQPRAMDATHAAHGQVSGAVMARVRAIARHYVLPRVLDQSARSADLDIVRVDNAARRAVAALHRITSRGTLPDDLPAQNNNKRVTVAAARVVSRAPPVSGVTAVANNTRFGVALFELGPHAVPVVVRANVPELDGATGRVYVRFTSIGGLMTQGNIGNVCAFAQLAYTYFTNFATLENGTVPVPAVISRADIAALQPRFACLRDRITLDVTLGGGCAVQNSNNDACLARARAALPAMVARLPLLLRPYVDADVARATVRAARDRAEQLRVTADFAAYGRGLARSLVRDMLDDSSAAVAGMWPPEWDGEWAASVNARLVEAWLWAQLAPQRLSVAIVGGTDALAVPQLLAPLLIGADVHDAQLMAAYAVRNPYAPPAPDTFRWRPRGAAATRKTKSATATRVPPPPMRACRLQHASHYHNKTEVLAGFALPSVRALSPLPFGVVRRLLSWLMFMTVRSKGAYSYFAFLSVIELPLCHADSAGVVVFDWQSGDYPRASHDNVRASLDDAQRAMEVPLPIEEYNAVVQGYLNSLPYLRQQSAFHMELIQYAGMRAVPSFGTRYVQDVRSDATFDVEQRVAGTARLDLFSAHYAAGAAASAAMAAELPTDDPVPSGALQCDGEAQ